MVIKAFGKARVIRLNEKLAKLGVNLGDIVAIQQYGGEGYLSLWVNKSKDIEAVIEEAGDKNKEIAVVKTLANTNVESWIKLKSKDGLTGYAARSNETIMWYATIDESKLCNPSHKKLLKNF